MIGVRKSASSEKRNYLTCQSSLHQLIAMALRRRPLAAYLYRFATPAFGPQGEPMPYVPADVQRRVRESDDEFRSRINLAIAKSNEQFGNTLWIAEHVDERGVPKRLRPATMAEYDSWLSRQIARIGEEIRKEQTGPDDYYGRPWGHAEYGRSPR